MKATPSIHVKKEPNMCQVSNALPPQNMETRLTPSVEKKQPSYARTDKCRTTDCLIKVSNKEQQAVPAAIYHCQYASVCTDLPSVSTSFEAHNIFAASNIDFICFACSLDL